MVLNNETERGCVADQPQHMNLELNERVSQTAEFFSFRFRRPNQSNTLEFLNVLRLVPHPHTGALQPFHKLRL
jgi:hypothetical protein